MKNNGHPTPNCFSPAHRAYRASDLSNLTVPKALISRLFTALNVNQIFFLDALLWRQISAPSVSALPAICVTFVLLSTSAQETTPFPTPSSKKGLQVQMVDDALALGVKHAALNVNLAQLLDPS